MNRSYRYACLAIIHSSTHKDKWSAIIVTLWIYTTICIYVKITQDCWSVFDEDQGASAFVSCTTTRPSIPPFTPSVRTCQGSEFHISLAKTALEKNIWNIISNFVAEMLHQRSELERSVVGIAKKLNTLKNLSLETTCDSQPR